MARSRLPGWAYVLIAVVIAALLALLVWALIPKPTNISAEGTPTSTPSATHSTAPVSTPTPVSSTTPTPAPSTNSGSGSGIGSSSSNASGSSGSSGSGSTTHTPPPPIDVTPAQVADLAGTEAPHSVVLTWTIPTDSKYSAAVVRRADGSTAPATATSGTAVATVSAPTAAVTDTGLTPGNTYTYAVFSRGTTGALSAAVTITVTLPYPLTFGTSDTTGTVTQVLPTGQTLSTTGTFDFTAFDPSGTRTATATAIGSSPLGSMTATVVEPVGSTPGTVAWNYSVNNELVRHLAAGQSASQQFSVSLSDGTDSISQTVTIEIDGVNDPPVVAAAIPDQAFTAGQPVSYTIPATTFSDPDGEALSYSLAGAPPAWLGIDSSTGALTGTPQASDEGPAQVTVAATDPSGAFTTTTLSFTVDAPPVANSDSLAWDLRYDNTSASTNVLTNDTGGVATLTAVPVTNGTFTLDNQTTVAGSYTLTSDGTLTLTPSSDNFGPLPLLHPGQIGDVTLTYQATDGVNAPVTGTVSVTITGRLDPVYLVNPLVGPDGQSLDFNDPTPTVFDATNTFDSPDPFYCENQFTLQNCDGTDTDYIQYSWAATSSTNLIPPDPAFISGADVKSVTALNSGWGFGSSCGVKVTAFPIDGRPAESTTINFFVGDAF